MKQILRILGLLFCCANLSFAAVTDWHKYAYDTYAARNFTGWPQMINTLQKTAFSPAGTTDSRLFVMTCYYGYIGHLLDIKQKEQASEWNKQANSIFKDLKDQLPDDPRVLALQSMFIAYDIAISPVKAPFQVGGMMSTARKALKEGPDELLANLANANILFYFPEALGGDKQKAITYYRKVYDFFKAHPAVAATDWMYLNVMSTLAVANEAVGNNKQAMFWINEALQVRPDFVYVKTILLPRIKQKLS
ncbi:MAG: hypothetical protein RR346_08540 [Bacteroidales bacterium]